jgi:hypothetical protein
LPSHDAGTPDPGLGWIKPPFCEDARRQAAEMGIDLADPTVLEALNELHQKKVDANEPGDTGASSHTVESFQIRDSFDIQDTERV